MRTSSALALTALLSVILLSCASPAIELEPGVATEEVPVACELHDWSWNASSLELELRIANHGDRVVVLDRRFLTLSDGKTRLAPRSAAATYRLWPHRRRTVFLRYPAVDASARSLTVEFAHGALRLEGPEGATITAAPLCLRVGEVRDRVPVAPPK